MQTHETRDKKVTGLTTTRGLNRAIEQAGGVRALARALGIGHTTVLQWKRKRLPAERVLQIERITGVSREELRPDLYRSR